MPVVKNAAVPKHQEQMQRLADFLEIDEIEYQDNPKGVLGEDYILKKDGKSVTLKIRATRDQGGFLSISDVS